MSKLSISRIGIREAGAAVPWDGGGDALRALGGRADRF